MAATARLTRLSADLTGATISAGFDAARWRTLPDVTPEQAQQPLDTWCTRRRDVRLRATADGKATVATIAAHEPCAPRRQCQSYCQDLWIKIF